MSYYETLQEKYFTDTSQILHNFVFAISSAVICFAISHKLSIFFGEWYGKVAACTLREIKSVRDTIKFYEDEILNYFIKRQTNASAESLNSKVKCFRAQVKGVKDIPFFMYRLATVLG